MRFKTYFIAYLLIYLFACANEKGITGGPKDINPPKLVSTFPSENQRTNFQGNKLVFQFDENIKLQSFPIEVRITPSLKGMEGSVSKNKLIIDFTEKLEENTTYTINFGNAIRDVTENNIAKNLIFAFSTGPQMDSLKLNGIVSNAMTNQPENDVLVALYSANDTLNIQHGNPKYYVYSQNGKFQFNYLKAGQYKVYAIKDANKNTKYDANELVDFYPQNIDLKGVNQEIQLKLFKESHQKNQILSVKQVENYVQIKTVRGIKKVNSKDNWIINLDGKSIKTYPTSPEEGKQYNFQVQLQDSLGRNIDTTFQLTYKTIPVNKIVLLEKVIPENYEYTPNDFQATLVFKEPIQVNKLELSTGKKSFPLEKSDYLLKNGNSELVINKKGINSDSIFILIHKESILSTINRENTLGKDSILFIKKKLELYASIRGKVTSNYSNYIVQLVDKNGKIVAQNENKASFEFLHVKPDTYSIRVLIDENKDNRFEEGSYLDKQRPEKIFFYPEPLLLKANWEINDVILAF